MMRRMKETGTISNVVLSVLERGYQHADRDNVLQRIWYDVKGIRPGARNRHNVFFPNQMIV
jgi:hypothetical protein